MKKTCVEDIRREIAKWNSRKKDSDTFEDRIAHGEEFANQVREWLGIKTLSAIPHTLCRKLAPVDGFPEIKTIPALGNKRLCEVLNYHVYLTNIRSDLIAAMEQRTGGEAPIDNATLVVLNGNFTKKRLIFSFYHELFHVLLAHPSRVRVLDIENPEQDRMAGLEIDYQRLNGMFYHEDEVIATRSGVEFVLPRMNLEEELEENGYDVPETVKKCIGMDEFMVVSVMEMNQFVVSGARKWWEENYKMKRYELLKEFFKTKRAPGEERIEKVINESQFALDQFCLKRCYPMQKCGRYFY